MSGFNVSRYGDSRWNRLADWLEWMMDRVFIPVLLMCLMGGFFLIVFALVVGLIVTVLA